MPPDNSPLCPHCGELGVPVEWHEYLNAQGQLKRLPATWDCSNHCSTEITPFVPGTLGTTEEDAQDAT